MVLDQQEVLSLALDPRHVTFRSPDRRQRFDTFEQPRFSLHRLFISESHVALAFGDEPVESFLAEDAADVADHLRGKFGMRIRKPRMPPVGKLPELSRTADALDTIVFL